MRVSKGEKSMVYKFGFSYNKTRAQTFLFVAMQ